MTYRILIVEDIKDNRFYLKTILEEQGHYVWEAENGKVAFDMYQDFLTSEKSTSCDLVMTDIGMPEMDGLELLSVLKKKDPELPVIIISAYREINQVIEALRLGACDYVTKPYEEQDIIESLKKVSHLIEMQVARHPCIAYLTKENRQFILKSDPKLIDLMAHFLSRDLRAFGLASKTHTMQVTLIEALSNAILHGNLEVPSRLKETDTFECCQLFDQEVAEKLSQKPYNSRTVTVDYALDEEKISYVIRDEGPGFNYKNLPDPFDPDNFMKPSGRGIFMIRSFCDEVRWNEQGNEITMVKYRK